MNSTMELSFKVVFQNEKKKKKKKKKKKQVLADPVNSA